MGAFMPYKNVETLVRAAALLPEHELHLMSHIEADERERLTALGPAARIVFHDGADDATYRTVLRGATALVTASRDEGFGLPLVEAMGVGTPLVVSDIPVFREVAGTAATYVDPDDVAGFVAAIHALDDDAVFARASDAARERGRALLVGALGAGPAGADGARGRPQAARRRVTSLRAITSR